VPKHVVVDMSLIVYHRVCMLDDILSIQEDTIKCNRLLTTFTADIVSVSRTECAV
jgi:hypothetical protein